MCGCISWPEGACRPKGAWESWQRPTGKGGRQPCLTRGAAITRASAARHGRENIHVRYRSRRHGEAEAIVTPGERDALHREGALVRDYGDSRYLASADNWPFADRLKRPQQ